MINLSVLQEDIRTLNLGAPDNRSINDMRQKLIEQAFTVIVKVFNTLHSEVDRPNRQKISEDTGELNSIIS